MVLSLIFKSSFISRMNQHPLRQHIEEIISLTDEDFAYILSHFKPIIRRKNQFVVQEGEAVHKEFFVVKGCLKTFFFDHGGKEHILQFSMENWWATDYEAFVNGTLATVSIDCIEDCELLYITYEDREKLSREMHKMERFWAIKTKLGYIALQKRILSLLKDTAQERHDKLLQQYPQLFMRVPKKLIAAYLGVSRETLSRLHF
jgi:CRP/FNR family cyclic AMP-dependent transcriptional regulator